MADTKPLNLGQDNEELCDLYGRLNALLDVPDPTAEEESDEEDDAKPKGAPKAIPFEYFADLVKIARGVMTIREYTERQTGLKRKITLRKDIVRLMTQVVMCSNEPEGMNCINQFKVMQECFKRYPDVYGAELADDAEDDLVPNVGDEQPDTP